MLFKGITMKNLQNKLEEIKSMGNYAVNLFYGEDIGCDDSNVSQKDRRITVSFFPVGCLGETQIMYKGTLGDFLDFNVKLQPVVISNPPKQEEYSGDGYFMWGTNNGVKKILAAPFHGAWE